jgi:hypothetical protein
MKDAATGLAIGAALIGWVVVSLLLIAVDPLVASGFALGVPTALIVRSNRG